MNCPHCGLTNPPEALTCDCGFDLKRATPFETPGWLEAPGSEINLAWRQKLAAYWSISWPAWVASLVLVFWLTSNYSLNDIENHRTAISLGGNLAFFATQLVLTRRLAGKNYRSFRVYVVHSGDRRFRSLSMREASLVWLQILWPQLALLLATSLVVWWYGDKLQPETMRAIPSLSQWLRMLVVGPYAVAVALRVKYPGFRLQAYGYRYV
jgi:hypothetical protein